MVYSASHHVPIVIANFTRVYEDYAFLRTSVSCIWVDCTGIVGTNGYCDEKAERILNDKLSACPLRAIHLLDNGNYHYLTYLWATRIAEDFSLVLFDRHSDMQKPQFGEILSCGGWVRYLLTRQPHVKQVFMVGTDPQRRAVFEGYEDRILLVKDLRDIETDWPFYISVDLDVLATTYMRTNWDQGTLSLAQLQSFLFGLWAYQKVLGVDLCGEDTRGIFHAQNEQVYRALIAQIDGALSF